MANVKFHKIANVSGKSEPNKFTDEFSLAEKNQRRKIGKENRFQIITRAL